MRSTAPSLLALLCLLTPTTLVGCDQLGDLSGLTGQASALHAEPEVDVASPELRSAPDIWALTAWFCPIVFEGPLGSITCTAAVGSVPDDEELNFELGVGVTIANPNDVPIPTLDLLLSLTMFDGADAEAVGSVCVAMCPADAADCDGKPDPDGCKEPSLILNQLDDYVASPDAVVGLIDGIASGESLDALRDGAELVAAGDVHLDLTFSLGVDQALSIIETTAEGWVDDALNGQVPSLDIPVSIDGTVFFDMPAAGRLGVDFGPVQASWLIE